MPVGENAVGENIKDPDPWACNGMPIPEVFSSRLAFLKVVALGVGITITLFGVLSLLLMHS